MSRAPGHDLSPGPPSLSVVRGLTYVDAMQVFNKWLIPTYQTTFRWTGNRADSEEATTWVLLSVGPQFGYPELVRVVDDRVVEASLEAVTRHWIRSYAMSPVRGSEMRASEAVGGGRPRTLEALLECLSAESRLLLVLRFLRKRSLPRIAAQLGMSPEIARYRMVAALTQVSEQIGLPAGSPESAQADLVSTYIDDIVGRRRPVRFDLLPEVWPVLVGANQVQAAIAGNSLPDQRFVRSLERRLPEVLERRVVTDLRIWSA